MSDLGTYMGVPIVINDALCHQKVSVRKHTDRGEVIRNRFFKNFLRKPSAYHLRIQKKWDKRFGVKDGSKFYLTPYAAIMSSDDYEKLKRLLQ